MRAVPSVISRVSTWRTRRSLALGAVAIVFMAVMAGLGWWQYSAYDAQQRDDARAAMRREPVPVDDVLGPDQQFRVEANSRPVTALGSYDGAEQFYVEDMPGSPLAYAVGTPLVTQSGSALIVIRGASDQPNASVPEGSIQVEGVLSPSASSGSPLDGQRITDGVRIPALLSEVSADLYAGYVVLRSSEPADSLEPIVPPLSEPSRWAGVRNLLYALQWWVFAGFVAFMWWRIVSTADPSASQVQGDQIASAP